jgi:Divergent InlB B-repeat domain/Fibronectin type III domain
MAIQVQKVPPSLSLSFPTSFFIGAFFFLLLVLTGQARAEQVSLAWDANTEPDLGGYKLYYGTATQAYSQVINVGKNTQVTVSNLSLGVTYFFAVTAYSLQGAESDYSNEINNTVRRQFRLTVTKRGSGDGIISGEGISCGADCDKWYDEGTPVTLTANPGQGSVFVGWSGDDCSGVGECTITLNTDKNLTAGLVLDGYNVTKKNRNMKGGTRLAGAVPQAEPSRPAGTIQNGSSTAEAPAVSSVYVIAKRNGLREKNSIFTQGFKQEAVLRYRNN